MTLSVQNLQTQLKQLRLVETSEVIPKLLREAETSSWTYMEFLTAVLSYEEQRREEKLIERHLKWAQLPFQKGLDTFDVNELPSLSMKQLNQLKEMTWLDENYNLIFLGPSGVGKTHLSVALGLEAIYNKQRVAFVTMGELIPLLKTETYIKKSQMRLKRIREADLVIMDDLMYMAIDQNEANLLFHLINHLYEKTSIILTSNKGPEEWGRLLGDQGIAMAILDRLLHRSEVIQFQGESHRLKYRETLFDSKTVQN